MAKPAKHLAIKNSAEADGALRDIGRLEDKIAAIHARESEIIRQANERAVAEAKPLLDVREMIVDAVEQWARAEEKAGVWQERSLTLTFGHLSFRLSPPSIKLLRKVEYVLERLRAKRMAIRVKEEIDKDALGAYSDEVLKEIGCKRVQKDLFSYEVFRPEVK